MRRALASLTSCAVAIGAAGCAVFTAPIAGVERVDPAQDYAERTRSALDGRELSQASLGVLQGYDLEGTLRDDPERALELLHERVKSDPRRETLFALAELAHSIARDRDSQPHHMASAVYAALYLFGFEDPVAADPYDRRFRWACDLYERGLTEALRAGDELALAARSWELPTGRLELELDASAFGWDPAGFRFLPAADYRPWGLRSPTRDRGVGVSLVARAEAFDPGADRMDLSRPPAPNLPATLVLELDGGLRDLAGGLPGRLELHRASAGARVLLSGRRVPLEADRATALAFAVSDERVWDFSITGFFSQGQLPEGLSRVDDYTPGRVPVVFVHGTASSPAYWAQTVGGLWADEELSRRIQTWVFTYSTGNPVLYSASKLRAALRQAVRELDPEGRDPALRRMVLVGHSQGGLLVRLMVVRGDVGWWEEVYGSPLDEWDFSPTDEALIRRSIEFEPVEEVSRVVFMSTPHRGSFVAGKGISHLIARLVELPGDLTNFVTSLQGQTERLPPGLAGETHTSVDNMDPRSPFSRELAETRFADRVHVHSIIAVEGDGDPTLGDDGVVEYSSAHLDEAESELIVPSSHSCQGHPLAILELRRILRFATGLPAAPARL